MKHDQAFELLAALSLDAVDEAERAAIDEHVRTCPKCQSELDGLLEVAGALGNSVEPLPEGLWSSISSRIYDEGEEDRPMPLLLPIDDVATRRARRFARPSARSVFSSIGAVAAALIVVLALNLSSEAHRVTNLQRQLAASSAVDAALATPGHTVVGPGELDEQRSGRIRARTRRTRLLGPLEFADASRG